MNKNTRYLVIATLIVFALYAVFWKYSANKFEKHIEEELIEVQSKGFDVSFDNLHIGGFPLGYDVVVTNLEVKRGKDFRTWVDGKITFSARIWKPQEISSVAGGTHHLEVDDFSTQGQGFVLKSFKFDPMRFEFFYDHLVLKVAGKEFLKAKELEFDIDFTPKNSADSASVRMRLEEMEAEPLKDSPLGPKIEKIIFDASLRGKISGDSTYNLVKNWYDDDGVLEVKEMALKWGETSISGDGTLALDDDLQPLGAFSVSFEGLNEAVESYVKADKLDAKKAMLLKAGIGLFHSASGSKISVTIQDRKASIASIPLFKLPEITW